MEEHRNLIVLICVSLYMVACVAIGLWALKRTKNTSDFFMAGRSLGVMITAIAVFSSVMSGFGFVGGPGLVYSMGMSSLWIVICTPMSFALSFLLLGKRLRMLGELRSCVSLPDVLAARFKSRPVRFLSAMAILFGVVAYLAVQIKAMAVVLQEIFAKNDIPGHDSLVACVVISSAVLVFYCVTGGIIASVYTDFFQGLVMVSAAVFVFFGVANSSSGGFSDMSQLMRADDPESIGPWGTLGIFGCLSWYFLFTMGAVGQPHVVTKLMMTRRIEDTRSMLPLTLLGYTLAALLWISIGMFMRAQVLNGYDPLTKADDAAPVFLQEFANPILAGIVFAGLFAAIMSTADGFLNIGAAAIVHDIPKSLSGRSLKRELLWARIATVGLAVGAAVFALASPMQLIGKLGAFGWGVFASALVPVVGLGLNWKRATPRAACVSMIASMAINIGVVIAQLCGWKPPYGIAGGAVALLVSLACFLGISLASKPVAIDKDVEAVMEI